jgi:mediator of RNA polymerase II transcription subunit 17
VQAGLTMSQDIKNVVPTGTLGADTLHEPLITQAQKQDNKRVAKGWKVQNNDKTVDMILNAASRLDDEVDSETRYWEEVISVSEKGWSLCRLPSERNTLGVRFGFLEASLTFRNQSLAALRRNADGSIFLDQGFTGTDPKALRVRIQVDEGDTGSSLVPKAASHDASIESLIQQARNTIFFTELWQELNRESRNLGGSEVRATEDFLILPLTSRKRAVMDLVSMEDFEQPAPQADDNLAQGLCLSFQLLLSYAHRQNHRRRTLPPPPISGQKRPNPPYNLLRPILTRLNHQKVANTLTTLLRQLTSLVTSASLESNFGVVHNQPQIHPSANFTNAERTIISLTDRLESVATYSPIPSTTITITFQTHQVSTGSTQFHLTVNQDSPLATIAPPPPWISDIEVVVEYIFYATAAAISASITQNLYPFEGEETAKSSPGSEGWHLTIQPNVLRKTFEGGIGKQIILDVSESAEKGMRFRVGWDWMRHDPFGTSSGKGSDQERKIKGEGAYEWRVQKGDSSKTDELAEVVRSFDDVVEQAGKWINE